MDSTSQHSPSYADLVDAAGASVAAMDGAETWPAQERLSAFFFLLLDGLEEAGIDASSFNRDASGFGSDFQDALREQLVHVLDAVDVPGINRFVTDTAPARFIVAEILVQLLSTSLADDSDGRERSAALADKTLAWAAAVVTNPVPSKTVDLARYAMEAGYLSWKRKK